MFLEKIVDKVRDARIPKHIRKNFKFISKDKQETLKNALVSSYFKDLHYSAGITPDQYLSSDEGEFDLLNHAFYRLNNFRARDIPWLDSIKRLSTANVLEIGCGTGASTLALSEQGAVVTGVDIDQSAIDVARTRSELYNIDFRLIHDNAMNIDRFARQAFDFVVFYATLEHLTIDERILSIRKAWGLLQAGGILVVIETPNRLWYFDDHTSFLPFFHWLPDQLAFYYTKMSTRKNFYNFSCDIGTLPPMEFHRLGRGASYHEFEIALGVKCEQINVIADLEEYSEKRAVNPVALLKIMFSKEKHYRRNLQSICPQIPSAFFRPYLNLAILKK